MGYAGAGGGQRLQLVIVEVDAMGIPHVGAGPAQPLQVGKGAQAEPLQGVLLLVPGLRHVGVQPYLQGAGQARTLPQQVGGHGEGGAGGQGYLAHGEAGRVVPHPHQPLRVGQNLVDGLYHAVRRQAAVLLGEIHGATGGVEAHAHQLSRPELGADQIPRPGGEDIVVVEAGGAPRLEQLRHAHQAGGGHHLFVQVFPHIVQRHQPGKELHPLHLGQIAGKELV